MTSEQPQHRWFALAALTIVSSQVTMIMSILHPTWLLPLVTVLTSAALFVALLTAYWRGRRDEIIKQIEQTKAETAMLLQLKEEIETKTHFLKMTGGGPLDGQTMAAPPPVATVLESLAENPDSPVQLTTTLSCYDEDDEVMGYYAFSEDDYHTLIWHPREDDE